jgi:formylglycine-generating enzyme required for sulfatase activity/tRNA A-37 threonylcarbamoyl transferase component Bud32
MQPPNNVTDPKVTVVQTADEIANFPQVPGYRILRRLGQGGMATVYLATQESLDRPVSIKVMAFNALTDETSKQRFENEARTIAKLQHPSIVSIYEVGRTADGRMYYIMPYLPNGDLSQRELSNDEPRIADVLRALLDALDYAHARGIVHRDVKLENVLFDSDNRPLLADFGIALSKTENVRITTAGLAVGSSGCMAPEQARGDAVDGRADLYSVGVLAYELLVGELPFRSSDAVSLALMHAQKPIPRLPAAKKHWQGFIDKSLAKSPDDRFQNAQQMLDALDKLDQRTGNRLSGRVVRRYDQTTSGRGWKRPLGIVLGGAALVAGGVYVAQHRATLISGAGTDASHPLVVVVREQAHPGAKPASGASSAAASAANSTAAAGVAIQQARAELAQGQLIEPAGKNAVEQTLAAWVLAPSTPDSQKLVADVLVALSAHQVQAIAQGDDTRAIDDQKKAQVLVEATVGAKDPAWKSFQSAANGAIAARTKKNTDASDNGALAKTQALAAKLNPAAAGAVATASAAPGAATAAASNPASAPAQTKAAPSMSEPEEANVTADATTLASARQNLTPAMNATMASKLGPDFVPLHGPFAGFPAAGIARAPVTHHEYADFVNATQRPASPCSNNRLLDFSSHRNWSDPGYAQQGDHPVVCVNWDDAMAYARWRSERENKRYRLPSRAEWEMATVNSNGTAVSHQGTVAANSGTPNVIGMTGLDANVGEWLFDCADACQKHFVAGRTWRNREHTTPSPRDATHGFDDVGFRLVRVLGNGRGKGGANAAADASPAATSGPAAADDQAQPNRRGFLFGRRHRKN